MTIFSSDRYQEVVVHDLRTPLNVIQLALRMLDDSECTKNDAAAEDLAMIRANALELERMLVHLVDYSRLPESSGELHPERFDPRALLEEVVHEVQSRSSSPIEVEDQARPGQVTLDMARSRMALQKSLLNAVAASGGSPVRVAMEDREDRCVSTFRVDVPPRDSVYSHEIDRLHFERLLGTAAERRGLDLAIASRISTLFGGSARLEAIRGKGTRLILDWPRQMNFDLA